MADVREKFHLGSKATRNDFERELGKVIKGFRRKKGLTPGKAAKRHGCSVDDWNRYEQGRVRSIKVVLLIGMTLGYDPLCFLEEVMGKVKRKLGE